MRAANRTVPNKARRTVETLRARSIINLKISALAFAPPRNALDASTRTTDATRRARTGQVEAHATSALARPGIVRKSEPATFHAASPARIGAVAITNDTALEVVDGTQKLYSRWYESIWPERSTTIESVGQETPLAAPATEAVPGGQRLHLEGDVAPVEGLKVSGLQSSHRSMSWAPLKMLKVPRGHGMHDEEPGVGC